ncbi:MAG: FAD-binding oxidoreductase [Sedimentitalea sp.]|nr:FAD-binding oxidoreductase [Sedimentitalea sp.]
MNTERLKTLIRGTVITQFEPARATACDDLIWNGRKPARSARIIVRAACADDVRQAVRFAADNHLTVSARGGGHQFSGIAARADLIVDLSALQGLRLDVTARKARLEPGVTNARLAAALDRHGLAFPVGHCGSVPVSGYLLGGGIGWNSAAWGFACFSVEAVEVVMADGSQLTANATENSEIFWAARGAGPDFFGIVTAFHVRLQPAARAISTAIRIFPPSAVADVADWAETVMATAPANIEFTAKVFVGPEGPVIAAIATVFAATDAESRSIQAQIGAGAPEALEVIGPMPTPFAALYEATAPSMPQGRRYGVDTVWSDGAYGILLSRVVDEMARAPSAESLALVVLRPNAVPTPSDAAFSRHGRIFGAVYAIWQDEDRDAANETWLRTAIDTLVPFCSGSYVGEADLDRPHRPLPTHSREASAHLSRLGATYDPMSRFAGSRRARPIAA